LGLLLPLVHYGLLQALAMPVLRLFLGLALDIPWLGLTLPDWGTPSGSKFSFSCVVAVVRDAAAWHFHTFGCCHHTMRT